MRVQAVVVALLCAVSGCTSDEGQKEPGPLPKVEHPKAPVPKDRDEQAVIAALDRLDACSLLDPKLAKMPGFPAGTPREPTGPHRCRIRATAGDMNVRVGRLLDGSSRFLMQPLDLGGVKAYRTPRQCKVVIPVSFTWVVSVEHELPREEDITGGCKAAKAFATFAVARLRNPAFLPRARWDGCTALRLATGQQPRPKSYEGLDECSLTGNPFEGRVELSYREPRTDFTSERSVWTIGGRRVIVSRSRLCYLRWQQGPSGSAVADRAALQVDLTVDCAKARQQATVMMKLMDGPVPRTQPQRPLVYRIGEPDQPRVGGCVDVIHEECEPYYPVVDAPKGFAEVARRVAADPHVECAIAVEAVRQNLGSRFRPVVVGKGRSCVFAEPTHIVELQVRINRFGALSKPPGAKELTVAGRRAVLVVVEALPEYTLTVEADGGVLELRMSLAAWKYFNGSAPVDTKPVSALEPIATVIAERFF